MKYILLIVILALSGCSAQITGRADVYYPKENGGRTYLSRQTFHTSRTARNMGDYK